MENYFSMLQDRTSQDPIRALVIIGILMMFIGLAIAIPRFSRNDEAGVNNPPPNLTIWRGLARNRKP